MSNAKLIALAQNGIVFTFYFLAIATPLIFTPASYELFEFPKMLLVYAGATVVLTFWTIKILAQGQFNFAPTSLFWPIMAFLASQIISTIISSDKITSIFGYYSRFHGGLLSTSAYIVLYFAAVSNLTKNQSLTLLFLFVTSALISSVWGIPSHFGADPTCKLLTGVWTSKCWSVQFDPTLRIFATFGQPNWMAGFLIMAILAQFGLTLAFKDFKLQTFGIVVNSILFWAFLLTNSRSASLALSVSLVIFLLILGFLRFGQKLKINFLPVGATLIIFAILTYFFGQSLLGRVKEVKIDRNLETVQTSGLPAEAQAVAGPTESGQIRLIVWKGAIEVFKHYPLAGTGVETFGYSYYNFRPAEHNLTTEWNFLYNKAHNEFLNYAATSGILGLGSFAAIIFFYTLYAIRYALQPNNQPSKLILIGLSTAVLAFLVHNFFGFSVVPTALFFWLAISSTSLIRAPNIKLVKFKPNKLLVLVPIAFLLFSIYILAKLYLADVNFAKGILQFEGGDYYQAESYFERANKLSPLPQPLFLSYAGYNLAVLSQADTNLVQNSIDLTEKSQQLSKVNLTTVRLAANTYLELSSVNPEYLVQVIELAEKLLKLAPTDAETHYQVAQILKIAGEDSQAEEIIKKAIELKPDYQAAIDTLDQWQKAK